MNPDVGVLEIFFAYSASIVQVVATSVVDQFFSFRPRANRMNFRLTISRLVSLILHVYRGMVHRLRGNAIEAYDTIRYDTIRQ